MRARPRAASTRRRDARERGSASAELVLLTPVLILFLLLYLGFGRITHAQQLVDDAAAQAARAATLNYLDPGQATNQADQTAAQALSAGGLSCTNENVTVETSDEHPGGAITVVLSCHADLSQAVAAGLPGALTLSASAASPVDVYLPTTLGLANPDTQPENERSSTPPTSPGSPS